MKVLPLDIPDVKLIVPDIYSDERGFFLESYSYSTFCKLGLPHVYVQDNHSRSVTGTIRGLHYQLMPGQTKLVRAVGGRILDVAVDIRRGSPTYGHWVAAELSAANQHAMFIPVGFAHGFGVLEGPADVLYKVDSGYNRALERGIRFDDPELGIAWSIKEPILSERDRQLPRLRDAECDFSYA